MTTEILEVAGALLSVEDTGGEKFPIVCLHSLFLDNRQFDQFTADAEVDFRIIRPDFRGQGRSSAATTEVITVEQCAGDIQALLDRMGISRAHFLVSSMGGDVGLRLVSNRPDLVRSMVITGSSARAEPADQLAEFREFVSAISEHGFVGDVLTTTQQIMLGKTTLADPDRRAIVELWTNRIAELPSTLAPAVSGVIERGSAVGLLRFIAAQCLVISGEECIARPPDWAKELADGLPNSQLWMLPEVGHSPLMEVPEIINPRIIRFFKEH